MCPNVPACFLAVSRNWWENPGFVPGIFFVVARCNPLDPTFCNMLALVSGALAFNVGSAVLVPTRAPVVSMATPLEGTFIYGPPVPASKGLKGFSSPTSFIADIEGKVVLTSAKPVAVKEVKPMAASFIYGSPTPASKGLPGFSWPTSFTPPPEASSSAPAAPVPVKEVTPMAAGFIYGSPVPASKGLPGFSWPTSFSN